MVEPAARPLRLVFCGTPAFAVPSLSALAAAGHELALVLTQPDRPSGRGMQMLAPPVKQWAEAHAIPVAQPATIRNNAELRTRLEQLAPDAIVVVAYGRIIPPWMLALPPLGHINLHGSLLPKYRGAAPIQWAVAEGERVTGVSTMLLEEGLDTGPVLEQLAIEIGPAETAADLFVRLAEQGAPLLVSTLHGLAAGTLVPRPQNHAESSHAPMLTREDGHIDFSVSARVIYNRWRGFQPWPGAWALLYGKKVTVTQMAASLLLSGGRAPGTLFMEQARLYAACGGASAVELAAVQLEGKRSMPAGDLLRGHPQLDGCRLV